jgi:tmRNA-binding protein
MAKDKVKDNVVAQNKKAHYDYEITETFEAGIVLTNCRSSQLDKLESISETVLRVLEMVRFG